MSEGAHLTSDVASLTLRLSDPATARFSLLRPGRRVPTREAAPTPGDWSKGGHYPAVESCWRRRFSR